MTKIKAKLNGFNFVPFTWGCGLAGFVHADTLKLFQKKDAAARLARAIQIAAEPAPPTGTDRALLMKQMSIINRANQAIRQAGTSFYPADTYELSN